MKPFTARKEKKPLEDFTAVELTHRYLQPSEWVGHLDTGDTLYMVANHRIIKIVKAPDMWKALVALKADDRARGALALAFQNVGDVIAQTQRRAVHAPQLAPTPIDH